MSADLLPLLSDTDRDLHEAVTGAAAILDRMLGDKPAADEDRTVDLAGDGYDWDGNR